MHILAGKTTMTNIPDYFLPSNFALERKEMFYLFNDALNTFYLRVYGVGHKMVTDYDSFICTIPQTR